MHPEGGDCKSPAAQSLEVSDCKDQEASFPEGGDEKSQEALCPEGGDGKSEAALCSEGGEGMKECLVLGDDASPEAWVEGYITDENANSVELTPEDNKVVPDVESKDGADVPQAEVAMQVSCPEPPVEGATEEPSPEHSPEGATGGPEVETPGGAEAGCEVSQDALGDAAENYPSRGSSPGTPQTPPR